MYGHFLIVTLTFFIVRLDQVASIPSGLVTCLPAQAVPCKLSGNFGTQSDSLIEPFLELVKDDVFRIKVIIEYYRVSDPHFFCGSGSGSGQKFSCGSGSWGYPGEGGGGKGKK